MKTFRDYEPNQLIILNLNELLPKKHLAHFISDVVEKLELSDIYDSYDGEKGGQPPYHPLMMVKVLMYGYCTGMRSSRAIERALRENVALLVLSANQQPDHASIASFRQRHFVAFSKLFTQVLDMVMEAGLVEHNHFTLDGSKIRANANRNKTMSLESLSKREERLKSAVARILAEAVEADRDEDNNSSTASSEQEGSNTKGNTKSASQKRLNRLKQRLVKMQQLRNRLEPEQRAKDEAEAAEKARKAEKPSNRGRNRKSEPPKEKPLHRNLTDYDSRIMPEAGGNWGNNYNAQAVVDDKNQIIVAAAVTNELTDKHQLIRMLNLAKANTGRTPKNASADNGYYSDANVTAKELKGTNLLVPPQKLEQRKFTRGKRMFAPADAMREKLQQPQNRALYSLRKSTVEPVFGQIKETVQGFRRFMCRGLEAVQREWQIVCMAHNLMKFYRSQCPA